MHTIAQTEAARTIELDAALFTATKRAKAAYPAEALRIERGLAIAIAGGVTLFADGSAWVASQSQPGEHYTVGRTCPCKDGKTTPHCKHIWARCLVKKARTLITEQPVPERYYATATLPNGERLQGVATKTERGWLFTDDDGFPQFYCAIEALELGGNIAIAESQREKDGDLVRKVCGY